MYGDELKESRQIRRIKRIFPITNGQMNRWDISQKIGWIKMEFYNAIAHIQHRSMRRGKLEHAREVKVRRASSVMKMTRPMLMRHCKENHVY